MNLRPNLKRYLLTSNDFNVVQFISRGAFGEVNLVENKVTHEQFAAKTILNSDGTNEENVKLISREISILARFHVPTIIRFYGYSTNDFKDRSLITLFIEYKDGGSLQNLLEKERNQEAPPDYNNTAKQIILCGIAHGMMTLHSRRVIHRDLKPDNILLDSNYRPSITDFGLSKILDNSKTVSGGPCGTMAYIAPEIFDGNHYSTKSDVYSFGILMFEVLTGEKAFGKQAGKKSFVKFASEVCKGKRPEFKTPIKHSFEQLIQQCWSANPRQRPSFRDLYHKLSLVLDDEDEGMNESLNSVHKEEEENEEEDVNDEYGYFRYFLDDVDVDKVLDYFEELSEVQPLKITEHEKRIETLKQEINLLKQHHQKEIESQTNSIKELQPENEIIKQQHKQEVEEQIKCIKELQQENDNIKQTLRKGLNFIISKLNETENQFQSIDFGKNEIASLQNAVTEPQNNIFVSDRILKVLRTEIQEFKLTQITIPSSVTSIGDGAFNNCISLKQVTIPSSVTSIGERAFSKCSSLTQVTIPSSVTSIGCIAFSSCSSLTQITIPSSVTSIGDAAFSSCRSLTQITIPSSVTSIGDAAFSGCRSLTQITIPSLVTSIGKYAFSTCTSLTQITIPSSVTSIGNWAFSECRSLTQITIPSSVTSIGNHAFSGCSSLTQITIPSSVTSIGDDAFSRCSKLDKSLKDVLQRQYGKGIFHYSRF